MQPNHRGKTVSGKTIPQRKELVKMIENKDQEIGRLLRRITYIEMVNNKTQAEADLIKNKFWFRTWLFNLLAKFRQKKEAKIA